MRFLEVIDKEDVVQLIVQLTPAKGIAFLTRSNQGTHSAFVAAVHQGILTRPQRPTSLAVAHYVEMGWDSFDDIACGVESSAVASRICSLLNDQAVLIADLETNHLWEKSVVSAGSRLIKIIQRGVAENALQENEETLTGKRYWDRPFLTRRDVDTIVPGSRLFFAYPLPWLTAELYHAVWSTSAEQQQSALEKIADILEDIVDSTDVEVQDDDLIEELVECGLLRRAVMLIVNPALRLHVLRVLGTASRSNGTYLGSRDVRRQAARHMEPCREALVQALVQWQPINRELAEKILDWYDNVLNVR